MLGPRIGNKIILLEETDSTNSHAARLLHENYVDEGTVIMAHFQKSGRGQRGTGWESVRGENLLVSYVLYPEFLESRDQFLFNQAVSLALRETVEQLSGKPAAIKWPNDIIADGCKISGVLIENTLRGNKIIHAIVGIGLNVNQTAFHTYTPPAISISQLTGQAQSPEKCLAVLSDNLDKWYTVLKLGNFQKIREQYLNHLFRKGLLSDFDSPNGYFTGTIHGVTPDGKLEIRFATGTLEVFDVKSLKLLSYQD